MKEQVVESVYAAMASFARGNDEVFLLRSEEVGGPPGNGMMLIDRVEGTTVMINVVETRHKKEVDTKKPSA